MTEDRRATAVHLSDVVQIGPCACCHKDNWIVDGERGEFWLLCYSEDCIEVQTLPEGWRVEQ